MFIVTAASCALAQGKTPVILIPGLTGSELFNSRTGQKVWYKTRRVRTDDLRLPIGQNLAANRDSLVPGDILRDVKAGPLPRTDIYGGFIAAMQTLGGYREARWDAPPPRGYENAIYVFPYDWRRDNVENARLLIRKIETLKRRLGRPNLKFNIVGHSMGGLIARYAAMYGDADIPAGDAAPTPTWAGARHMDKLIIMGTPNEGSPLSLKNMLNGFNVFGVDVNLPFVQNLSKFDIFTIPAAFELLPAPGTWKVFDENLAPIEVDLYDAATWTKYGWNVIDDKDFGKHFASTDKTSAGAYFRTVLARAKKFQLAMSALSNRVIPVSINLIGSDCKDTPDAMVLYQKKDGKWEAVFKPDSFETAGGRKVTAEELKALIMAPGDGIVSKRSLAAITLAQSAGIASIFTPASATYICEGHDKLPSNVEVQKQVLSILSGGK